MIDQDVIGIAREGENANIQILFIRNGMMTGRKDFFWDDLKDTDNGEIITSFIEQFYRDEIDTRRDISACELERHRQGHGAPCPTVEIALSKKGEKRFTSGSQGA